MRHYILVNGEPKGTEDILEYCQWFENSDQERIIKQTTVPTKNGEIFVSTVFLGIDHNFSALVCRMGDKQHEPVLWETMIFGGAMDGACNRYSSKQDAMAGHLTMMLRALQAEE